MLIKGLGEKSLDEVDEVEKELRKLSYEEMLQKFKKFYCKAQEQQEELAKLRKQVSDASWLDSRGNPTYQNGA